MKGQCHLLTLVQGQSDSTLKLNLYHKKSLRYVPFDKVQHGAIAVGFAAILTCYGVGMVSHYVIIEYCVLHPRSDSWNWPRSAEYGITITIPLM